MLPAVHRLRRADEFRRALRTGDRAGSRLLVLYRASSEPGSTTELPARIGFVVSRQVGPAVVRNRVKRRLRHQTAARVDRLAPGALYVVRANPAAATATSDQLGEALASCLDTLGRGER